MLLFGVQNRSPARHGSGVTNSLHFQIFSCRAGNVANLCNCLFPIQFAILCFPHRPRRRLGRWGTEGSRQ